MLMTCYSLDLSATPKVWTAIDSLPGQQAHHGFVFVPLANKIYSIGGYKSAYTVQGLVFVYDLEAETWSTASMGSFLNDVTQRGDWVFW